MVIPNAPYEIAEKIGDFMEKDFTIFIRAKLNVNSLIKGKEMYFFARNGKHCGLCAFINHENKLCVQCTYWFVIDNGDEKYLQIRYELPEQLQNEFNNYFITCDHEKRIISFYVNGVLAGELDYNDMNKLNYTDSFIWLGCANMMVNDEFNNVAEIEFEMFITLTKCLSVGDMYSLINNYKRKYSYKKFDYQLPVLSKETPNYENFKLFCDFELQNYYKVWNLVNNGNFLQKYIKDNIYY
jgi:hypothetical protein